MFVSVRERAARSALRRDRALGGWEHTSSGEVSPGWVYKHGHAQDERGGGSRGAGRGPGRREEVCAATDRGSLWYTVYVIGGRTCYTYRTTRTFNIQQTSSNHRHDLNFRSPTLPPRRLPEVRFDLKRVRRFA
jgi:hypothetical protein